MAVISFRVRCACHQFVEDTALVHQFVVRADFGDLAVI
jgi:hypothetical protein